MAERPGRSARALSIVPYEPDPSRQIILRHNSTIVLYDKRSKQISLRSDDSDRCPTCNRLWGEESHVSETASTSPSYWNTLSHSLIAPESAIGISSSSPHFEPYADPPTPPPPPPVRGAAGISASSFSHNYFKTFFRVEKELGKGGRGVVMLVSHYLDNCFLGQFACKRVPVGNDHQWLQKVLLEVQTLQQLSHRNLVQYKHVWLENAKINNFGPEIPCAFMLQQYCDSGDLHNYVLKGSKISLPPKERLRRRSKGRVEDFLARHMSFDDIFLFFMDITSGLNHLHAHGFIHRDVKPSNCLLHNNGRRLQVLLSDFGEVQVSNSSRRGSGATGTVSYCAPEVLRRDGDAYGNFTIKSDVFSLGMVVYFMCFARLPYSNAEDINQDREDVDLLRAEILTWQGINDAEKRGRSDLPDTLYTSLKRLLAVDPEIRPSTDEILHEIRARKPPEDDFFKDETVDERDRISNVDSPAPAAKPLSSNSLLSPLSRSRRLSPAKPAPLSLIRSRRPHVVSPSPSPPHVSPSFAPAQKSPSATHSPVAVPLALPPPPPPSFIQNLIMMAPLVFRLLTFSLKCITLWSPCQPLSVKVTVAYPLLLLAALDFSIFPLNVRITTFLTLLHFGIVFLTGRYGHLCESIGGTRLNWDDNFVP